MAEFQRFRKIIGEDTFSFLKEQSVCVIGLGGVGGYTVEALARSGIGTLILVDHDTVDITNINRQMIALHSTIGKKKIDLWKERVLDINPTCHVICYDMFYEEDNKETLFQNKIDYLVDACDTMQSKKSLISTCLEKKIPFISCMGTGNRIDPSKLEIMELQKTSYDPLARILRKWVKEERIRGKIPVLSSKEQPIKIHEKTPGSSAFVPSSAGLLIASNIIQWFQKEKKHHHS